MPAALNKKACTLEKHMEDYPIVSNTPSAEVLGDKNVSETLPTALLTQALTTLTNLNILHILQQELVDE